MEFNVDKHILQNRISISPSPLNDHQTIIFEAPVSFFAAKSLCVHSCRYNMIACDALFPEFCLIYLRSYKWLEESATECHQRSFSSSFKSLRCCTATHRKGYRCRGARVKDKWVSSLLQGHSEELKWMGVVWCQKIHQVRMIGPYHGYTQH